MSMMKEMTKKPRDGWDDQETWGGMDGIAGKKEGKEVTEGH